MGDAENERLILLRRRGTRASDDRRKMWCPSCQEEVVPNGNECWCGSACEPTRAEVIALARADALEEAAKTCDAVAREARANVSQCDQIAADVADRLAAAIRALRGDG